MDVPGPAWTDARATVEGAVGGVAAFALGLAATFALQRDDFEGGRAVADELAGGLDPALAEALDGLAEWLEPDLVEAVAWFHYAAHGVLLDVSVRVFGQSARWTADVRETALWDGTVAVVPPLLLVAAGAVLARRHAETPVDAVAAAARLALGYAVAAAVVVDAATYTRDAGFAAVTVQPPLVTAVAYCAAYALGFGAVGALAALALGGRVGRWRESVE